MKRMKEEEELKERGRRCSGMEAMTVIIPIQTDYHRASGNELLMLSLQVRIYIDGDVVVSVIVVTVIPKPQAHGIR